MHTDIVRAFIPYNIIENIYINFTLFFDIGTGNHEANLN